MELIFHNIDDESYLIVGLTCKEMYGLLKAFNDNKKLNGTCRYLTSNLNLLKYAHLLLITLRQLTLPFVTALTFPPTGFRLKWIKRPFVVAGGIDPAFDTIALDKLLKAEPGEYDPDRSHNR